MRALSTSNDRVRRLFQANPRIDFFTSTVDFHVRYFLQVADGQGGWLNLDESRHIPNRSVLITNTMHVDPATGLLDDNGTVPAFDYLMSRTGTDMGMESLGQMVIPLMGPFVENFLEANNLV